MYRGSCLCGVVTYEIDGELGDGYFCHCSRCRKASGSAYAANARLLPNQFRVLTGQESLKSYYHPASGLTRKFCAECGSPIVSERSEPPMLAVRLGTLDTPLHDSPIRGHIFVGSKAEWDEITDDLPQFAERPTS
ncbi:MAG: GFA family protein [Gammaproteobacteria bacterium]|nr:GFA family protein [Gammaproteobacteria bacterium]